ncbi:MAG TPA: glycosyltransferase family 2 protein [Vicinamibacterales bacterium]|jgi:glycosyltransferase involved in cell wall biosynthesis
MKLAASMVVKNELGRYLPECIGHLREFCDLVVVLDDGSTDRTGEWLDDNTDEMMVVQHLDPSDGFFSGHEGRKRNELLRFTLNQLPDWVLAIDADEFISDGQAVRDYCAGPREVGTLEMEEVWRCDKKGMQLRMDGGWRPHPVPSLWSARLSGRRGQALHIPDRALACGREPDAVRRLFGRARSTGSSILHFGWAKEADRQGRYDRYVKADGGQFHANAHLESIMWPDEKVRLQERVWPTDLKRFRDQIVTDASS